MQRTNEATMVHEMMVALCVTDEALYRQYREAMTPLLAAHGGGFRYDFTVAEVLRSDSAHPINRVFTIHFAARAQTDAFFAHPEYLAIRKRWFEGSTGGVTLVGAWDR